MSRKGEPRPRRNETLRLAVWLMTRGGMSSREIGEVIGRSKTRVEQLRGKKTA